MEIEDMVSSPLEGGVEALIFDGHREWFRELGYRRGLKSWFMKTVSAEIPEV